MYNGQDCGFVLSESENQWPETYAENIEGFFEEMNDSETGAFGFDIGSSLNIKYLRFEGSLTYEWVLKNKILKVPCDIHILLIIPVRVTTQGKR